MDPFLHLISLLRPQAALWHQIDAVGRWALSFRKREDVLFCSVLQGSCWLVQPGRTTLSLAAGDFVLVRTDAPFRLASDRTAKAETSERVFAKASSGTFVKLGSGQERPVKLSGGRIAFDPTNEGLLLGLLPPLIHLSVAKPVAGRAQALLQLSLAESREPGPGSDFVVARLIELLFVHLLRERSLSFTGRNGGLLAGLEDPVIAVALRCLHADLAHGWTVAALAKRAGVSRSSFAGRFRRIVGTGPIEYLLRWRLAEAKDKLRQGTQTVAEIAFAVGFQSASAFSTSFRRETGSAPTQYVSSTQPA